MLACVPNHGLVVGVDDEHGHGPRRIGREHLGGEQAEAAVKHGGVPGQLAGVGYIGHIAGRAAQQRLCSPCLRDKL